MCEALHKIHSFVHKGQILQCYVLARDIMKSRMWVSVFWKSIFPQFYAMKMAERNAFSLSVQYCKIHAKTRSAARMRGLFSSHLYLYIKSDILWRSISTSKIRYISELTSVLLLPTTSLLLPTEKCGLVGPWLIEWMSRNVCPSLSPARGHRLSISVWLINGTSPRTQGNSVHFCNLFLTFGFIPIIHWLMKALKDSVIYLLY